ncbi:hypothetical protein EZS27_007773 [termite gut metagenome]|uniref:Uncharacterized protein n=1 Tax=termite gut metagenome TaxID=433724 RepID=A0A5J4SGY2_9ZZZZ
MRHYLTDLTDIHSGAILAIINDKRKGATSIIQGKRMKKEIHTEAYILSIVKLI